METDTIASLPLWRRVLDDPRVRYVIVGCIAAMIYYAAFSTLWLALRGHLTVTTGRPRPAGYLTAAVIANAVTAVTMFPLYRRHVFRSHGPWLPGLARFYLIGVWSLAWSLVGLPLLVEVGHLPVLLAQAGIVVLIPLVNYPINKYWTFRSPRGGRTARFLVRGTRR
jgi:putative flippase GtrA